MADNYIIVDNFSYDFYLDLYKMGQIERKILGYGLDGAGEVKDKLDLLKNAYEIGKRV
ncbi:MAG: hypothetical protein IKC71_03980 [Clostridia bacterium]|nr:hypothetical protein [Clostridia bacterium]